MSQEKQIHVFIVEDDKAATEIMKKYFAPKGGPLTYAAVVDADLRPELVEAIDGIQEL